MSDSGLRRSGRKRHFSSFHDDTLAAPLWSDEEKMNLLKALKKHGHMDISSLRKAVPRKSDSQIKKFINSSWKAARWTLLANARKARKGTKRNDSYFGPTDKWLDIISTQFRSFDDYKLVPIARAILFISKYEKHPDPSECGGVNFQDLYEFIHSMLCGFPPKVLNRATATFVLDTMKSFAHNISREDFQEEADFLKSCSQLVCPNTLSLKQDNEKNLSRSSNECFSELMQLPGFNPFDVPKEMLERIFGPAPEVVTLD